MNIIKRKYFYALAFAFGVIAFIFICLIAGSNGGDRPIELGFSSIYLGGKNAKSEVYIGALWPFIGFILMIVATIMFAALAIKNSHGTLTSFKIEVALCITSAVLMLVGSILVALTTSIFTSANKELFDALEAAQNPLSIRRFDIVGAVCGFMATLIGSLGLFAKDI